MNILKKLQKSIKGSWSGIVNNELYPKHNRLDQKIKVKAKTRWKSYYCSAKEQEGLHAGLLCKGVFWMQAENPCILFKVKKVSQQGVEKYNWNSGRREWTAVK